MPYTPEMASNFWLEYDDRFQFRAPAAVRQAYRQVRGLDYALNRWQQRRLEGTYPAEFVADMTPLGAGLRTLSTEQLAIIDRHFGGDEEATRRTFEDFAQGILFDDRRPLGVKVHMMDTSGPANPPIGYHRWYALGRAMVLTGVDAARWTTLLGYVALAWAIQSEARPRQDAHNPPMDAARLQTLRDAWLPRDPDELDRGFDNFPYPPPV